MCIYVRICVHSAKEVYCLFQKDDIGTKPNNGDELIDLPKHRVGIVMKLFVDHIHHLFELGY